MTHYEALNLVNVTRFTKKYDLKIKGIYHKKQGYNTSNHEYSFSAKEKEEIKRALSQFAEDLLNLDFLNE